MVRGGPARRAADNVFIPFTIGGGIRSEEDVRALLAAGADKVSLNSAAIKDPNLISACARRFGSQCVVLAIDCRRTQAATNDSTVWEVYINGGRTPMGLDAIEWARRGEELGAGAALGEFHLAAAELAL